MIKNIKQNFDKTTFKPDLPCSKKDVENGQIILNFLCTNDFKFPDVRIKTHDW